MTSNSKVYLITGANRGIGFHLVKQLSIRPNTIVIATSRVPETATELQHLSKEFPNVHVVKYDANSRSDATALRDQVEEIVDGIDVLIGNAGIAQSHYTILETPDEKWLNHYNINVLGPIYLYQSLYPLLEKRDTKQIVFISSLAGSISQYFPVPSSAYGQSKAALNYSVKEMSSESQADGFTVISVHPGVVDTDMGKSSLARLGEIDPKSSELLSSLLITPEQSAEQQLKVIDGLTKEDTGKFLNYDGTSAPF